MDWSESGDPAPGFIIGEELVASRPQDNLVVNVGDVDLSKVCVWVCVCVCVRMHVCVRMYMCAHVCVFITVYGPGTGCRTRSSPP